MDDAAIPLAQVWDANTVSDDLMGRVTVGFDTLLDGSGRSKSHVLTLLVSRRCACSCEFGVASRARRARLAEAV